MTSEESELRKAASVGMTGFEMVEHAVGDLNRDGIDDIAAIFAKLSAKADGAVDERRATLRVLFAEKSGNARLVSETKLCVACGGIKGDTVPFTISANKGVLHLIFTGGSREMYETTTKWRSQVAPFS